MNNKNWFRNEVWNEEIEKHFFPKLQRVRNKNMQAQYLRLQAGALVYTQDKKLMQVAEALLSKLQADYPDNKFEKGQVLTLKGDIYKFNNEYQKALDYYKQAIDFEATSPNVITNAYMDYAKLVVKTNRTDLFDDVEKIFTEERYADGDIFPLTRYLKYSILSIIAKYKNDKEKAKYYADLANENAEMQQSGLNNHKTLGLVRERDKKLDSLVQKE